MHYLDPENAAAYANLLRAADVDLACIGIGENGHIAFNDPPVADFNDPMLVKLVELDDACRKQQLGEGWFPSMAAVPTRRLPPATSNPSMAETACRFGFPHHLHLPSPLTLGSNPRATDAILSSRNPLIT